MAKLENAIRKAINASGQTRYRIAQETGVSQAMLSRFINGERGLSVVMLELLADYLGLEIIIRPKRRKARR